LHLLCLLLRHLRLPQWPLQQEHWRLHLPLLGLRYLLFLVLRHLPFLGLQRLRCLALWHLPFLGQVRQRLRWQEKMPRWKLRQLHWVAMQL